MELSRNTTKKFSELINSPQSSPSNVAYGTIVERDGRYYAQIDGTESEILTPVSSTVDIKDKDRVAITVRNHQATVTGNLTEPAVGNWRIDELGNMIFESYVTFESLENGTTVIDGACIKTGTIDAERINLTGIIKVQYSVDGVSNWHEEMADTDYYRRDSFDGGQTWGNPYKFKGKDGSSAYLPAYITSTYIDATRVESFYIKGNKIEAVIPYGAEDDQDTGFILTAAYGDKSYQYCRIHAYEGLSPYTVFSSPCAGYAEWTFPWTYFRKNVDFSSATVYGLYLTFS